jgi:repressor LexA
VRAPTERQREILDFIREWTQRQKYPPTIREIGDGLGISSTNGVNDHLLALQKRGLVAWQPHCNRTLRLTSAGHSVLLMGAA